MVGWRHQGLRQMVTLKFVAMATGGQQIDRHDTLQSISDVIVHCDQSTKSSLVVIMNTEAL